MYPGVPTAMPVPVTLLTPATPSARAMPKSLTTA